MTARRYLLAEAALILLWAAVLVALGGNNGLVQFPLQAAGLVLAVGVLGGWMIWRLRSGGPRLGLEAAWLVWLAATGVGVAFSEDPRRSAPFLIPVVGFALAFYMLTDALRSGLPAELVEKTWLIIGAVVLGLSLFDAAQAWVNWSLLAAALAAPPPFALRLYGLPGDPNLLAGFANLLWPLAWQRWRSTTAAVPRWALAVWLAAAGLTLVLTRSRGAWLGALAAGLVLAGQWAWPRWLKTRRRRWLAAGACLLVAVGGAALVLSAQAEVSQQSAVESRAGVWAAAWRGFSARPLTGRGPGLYPVDWLASQSVPPATVFANAHSVYFNVAAEMGVVGLLALGAAAALAARAAWRTRRPADLRWQGALAALAAFLTHSLVDDHSRFWMIGLLAVLILALMLSSAEAPPVPRAAILAWAVPAALAALGMGLILRGYGLVYAGAQAAERGDWPAAAELFDRAAQADPALGWNWEQAALAQARLGDLPRALSRAERAAQLAPEYAVHHFNVGVLAAALGRRPQAEAALREAAVRAPAWPAPHIELGALQEAAGQPEAARADYAAALALDPSLAAGVFWSQTALRRGVAQAVPTPPAPTDLRDPQVYVQAAQQAAAQGDWARAEQQARLELLLPSSDVRADVWATAVLARVAAERGQTDEALARYATAFHAATDYNTAGWGSAGWTPYSFFAFQRQGLPVEVVPQALHPEYPRLMSEWLLPLGGLYVQAGRPAEARAFYQRVLALDPGFAPAQAALASLEAAP